MRYDMRYFGVQIDKIGVRCSFSFLETKTKPT